MASATGPGRPLVISRKEEGRSPLGVGALSLARACNPQAEEENAHGEVYRAGRACVKLHGGGSGPKREAAELARGGDERAGADRGTARHPAEPARVPRGRNALGVAARGARTSRGGAGGGGGAQESWPEERQARRVCTGGAAPDRSARDAGVQGAREVPEAGLFGASSRARGRRCGTREEPAEERAALPGRRLRSRTLGLHEGRPRALARCVAQADTAPGRVAVRGARCTRGSEGESREGAAEGGVQAPGVATREDRARAWARSGRPSCYRWW